MERLQGEKPRKEWWKKQWGTDESVGVGERMRRWWAMLPGSAKGGEGAQGDGAEKEDRGQHLPIAMKSAGGRGGGGCCISAGTRLHFIGS